MRCLGLLLLATLPARSDDIEIARTMTVADLLDDAAERHGWLLFYPPNDRHFEDQRLGGDFHHQVPPRRLIDTYGAILAFFECGLTEVAGGDLLLVGRDRALPFRPRPKPARGRFPCAVAGMGGRSVLELAYPLHAIRHDVTLLRNALTRRGRERLLCTLRGLHAGARAKAARALGILGPADDETVRRLREARLDEDVHVRREARAALARIRRPR